MITLTYDDKPKLAAEIAGYKHQWNSARIESRNMWAEIDGYIHATDTSMLEGGDFFDHKTFIPVISEIHEDLIAIIYSTVFPHEDWLGWKGFDVKAIAKEKRAKLLSFIKQVHSLNAFSTTFRKVIDDLVRYGNCFTKVGYVNETQTEDDESVSGYVGPKPIRISPYDIVFNPSVSDFTKTPKIITSLISTGEFKEFVDSLGDKSEISSEQLRLLLNRRSGGDSDNSDIDKEPQYIAAGFGSIKEYYTSGMVELLWFYGDIFDAVGHDIYKGRCVIVVDGNTVIYDEYEPKSKIFKGSWKPRPDNLWSQGPLDNLVGINYMINHRENSKNDSIDSFANPDRAYVGDVEEIYDEVTGQTKYIMPEGGSVTDIVPDASVLTYDNQISMHIEMARRAARIPQQLTGFKTSGEKTAFEVQNLNDGAFRGFINKATQFEEDVIEPTITAEIRVARDNFSSVIKVLEEQEATMLAEQELEKTMSQPTATEMEMDAEMEVEDEL